jgi:hypothetical protein
MTYSSQMKNLSEDIVASFKQRIKENAELVIEVQKTLNGFQKDHQDMATALNADALALRVKLDKDEQKRLKDSDIFLKKISKENKNMATALRSGLNEGEKNRMKEFVVLMKSINNKVSEIFTYTDNLLETSETERLKEFDILIKNINAEVSEIFTYTHSMLEKSEVNRLEEFSILMKGINEEILRIFTHTHSLLSNGETERLKEFHVVLKGIQNDVKNLKKAVAELLGDFAQDRKGVSAAWKKMSEVLAQLRNKAVTLPKQAIKKEVKTARVEAVQETPVEETPVEETPVEVQPKVKAEAGIPKTLEEKVTDYINKHPQGVRVSEMEGPLGETRMKLGFVAKLLLGEGKVQKVENVYFPIEV